MQNNTLPISIIIPVFNEELVIENILNQVSHLNASEIIIVDGQSTDATVDLIKHYDVQLYVADHRSRSFQMNLGAKAATTPYLFFLHADVKLPENFNSILRKAIEHKVILANFKIQFDWDQWFLKANAFFSRFTWNGFQFGDQGLFIENKLFKQIEGYDNGLPLAEGNEIIRRARRHAKLTKLDTNLLVSARKYKKHGVYKLQLYYFLIYSLIRIGINQKLILKIYYKLLKE
ncbi:MAG: TIGR04283 family arsenosugar biosynthesis glycosyltransferase [Vicingaceae bacterium]